VLDDEPAVTDLLIRLLSKLGYTPVDACNTGAEALQRLAAEGPAIDLILMDINMPEMDGVQFLRRLAAQRFPGGLVLLSGEDDTTRKSVERLISSHDLRAVGSLRKPFTQGQLAATVKEALLLSRDTAPGATPHRYDAEQLTRALRNDELVCYYQPQCELATGDVVGIETLVRWQHPHDGLVLPNQFLPLIRDLRLLPEVTRVVLASAIAQAAEWLSAGRQFYVALNVSMQDIAQVEFADTVATLAHNLRCEPSHITVEVTEAETMEQIGTALDVLTRLRLRRFVLSLDDFGTGYSSMAQLRDLPFDELKIDRSFVHGATKDSRLRAICSASIRMAHQLGLQVVAEGIEDRGDWELLRYLGCDIGQGYFIAKPMPAPEMDSWLMSQMTSRRKSRANGGREKDDGAAR
jgi:EAL domain-containing protein (putative c-di-GMP-specific phosphodiesterase class I)